MKSGRWDRADWLALAGLLAANLILYGRVLFTNLVLASGDFLFYFTPYWDYLNRLLRSGQMPLWNPYIFAGAPLLANPQVQVFYPLRYLFLALPAEKGILYFAALHAWLAALFTYLLIRKGWGMHPLAGLAAGLIYALNGWMMGLLSHPVRWGVVVWLPCALYLWEVRPWRLAKVTWRSQAVRRWLVFMVGAWSLPWLAGHSQTFYNQVLIFGVWVVGSSAYGPLKERRWREAMVRVARVTLLFALILAIVAAFTAIQLVPTLELSGLSYRAGGLDFRDHAALSLPPWRLGLTLLPHYARNLGQSFGSDAYAEWLAYIGLAGLCLAWFGLLFGRGRIRFMALFLSGMGILLAFGAYNPLEYLLFELIPGWGLFRVPARWLQAAMMGFAILAAVGADALLGGQADRIRRDRRQRLLLAIPLLVLVLIAILSNPNMWTVVGWLIPLLVVFAWWQNRLSDMTAVTLLAVIMVVEMYAASYGLPIQHPTAPQAVRSWRTAPARMAAEMAPGCRLLSLSTTTYDPGDLQELRQIYSPYLDEWAMSDLVDASKAREVVAPNVGMLARLPSLDGFGGGLLPTRHFVKSMGLLLPGETVVADGRLREQLREVPDARLLSLLGVCYVITDKTFDAWHDDVYYDLTFGESLTADSPSLTITDLPHFPVNEVGVVSHMLGGSGLATGQPVALITLEYQDGSRWQQTLKAGEQTAEGNDATAGLAHRRPDLPHVRWRFDAPGQDTIALLHAPPPQDPTDLLSQVPAAIHIELLRPDVSLFVRGLALRDDRSGAHATPVVSRHPWRRIHSGDVKIYRNDGVLPRATFVAEALVSGTEDAALLHLSDANHDPARTTLLMGGQGRSGGEGKVTIVAENPTEVHMVVEAMSEGYVRLADAWYPGWQALLDGNPVPVERTDLLLRAVAVPEGRHELVMRFRPASFRWGGLLTAVLSIWLVGLWLWPRHRERSSLGDLDDA